MTQQIPHVNISTASPTVWRVKRSIKTFVIVLSILALSLVFEGWRQINNGMTAGHTAVLFGGLVSTAFLLWLQAFWIYMEEKSKGTLKKKVVHFDRLQEYIEQKRGQKD